MILCLRRCVCKVKRERMLFPRALVVFPRLSYMCRQKGQVWMDNLGGVLGRTRLFIIHRCVVALMQKWQRTEEEMRKETVTECVASAQDSGCYWCDIPSRSIWQG